MTTPADYRALLQRLVNAIDAEPGDVPCLRENLTAAYRAAFDALLAAPEAVGVSNGQLVDLAGDHLGFYLTPDEEEGVIEFARAVLARYAHPAPVPVGERLPGVGDCCPHPRRGIREWCWGLENDRTSYGLECVWRLMEVEDIPVHASHWLPHWALPLPGDQP